MWVLSKHGFISVVRGEDADGERVDGTVQLRSRDRDHIVNVLKASGNSQYIKKILALRGRDYAYRVVVPSDLFAGILGALAAGVTYDNFKGEVDAHCKPDDPYAPALHRIWHVLFDAYTRVRPRWTERRFTHLDISAAPEEEVAIRVSTYRKRR